MAFLDRLLNRRDLETIQGFAGGNLQEQLDDDERQALGQNRGVALGSPSRMEGVASSSSPQPTMADRAMATAVPVEETRQRSAENPFLNRLMQPQSRERRTQPQDVVADHSRYLSDLENQPLSFGDKAAMVSQAIARSLGQQPLPTKREMRLGRAENQLGRDVAMETERSRRDVQRSQIDAREAGIATAQARLDQGDLKLKQDREKFEFSRKKPHITKDAQGRVIKITPQDEGPDKVETLSNVTKTKVPHTVWADGRLKIWNPETSRYDDAKDTQDREVTDELRTPVEVEINGQKFRVAPNTAAMATATGERFDITESRAERGEQRQDQRDYRAREAKAADLVGKIDGAKAAMATANAKLIKHPNDADAREEFEGARAYAIQASKELNEGYGDLYESGTGNEGTPYYKKKDGAAPTQAPRGVSAAPQGKLDVKIAIRRAQTKKGGVLTPDEEAKVRAEVDRRNQGRQ